MARKLTDDPTVTDGRMKDTKRREIERERAKRRYWSSAEARQAKIDAVKRWREDHPERFRDVLLMARKRKRRGIQRAYRKTAP